MKPIEKESSIVRQSSLKFVGEYCRSTNMNLTLKEIIGITNVITDYCLYGYNKEIGERLDKIDSHLREKFEELS
jgi:hypothetical protein